MLMKWEGGQLMNVEVIGFTCRRIEAIKTYREVVLPALKLTDVKVIIDSMAKGHPIPLMLEESQLKRLLASGFTIEYPVKREVKVLMNQLIQRFLSMGEKQYANQLIQMWLEMLKKEG